MNKIPYPSKIDKSIFSNQAGITEAKYGLPSDVQYCMRCVISNQRPNSAIEYSHIKNTQKKTISFDEQSVCDACKFAERKQTDINWKERELWVEEAGLKLHRAVWTRTTQE